MISSTNKLLVYTSKYNEKISNIYLMYSITCILIYLPCERQILFRNAKNFLHLFVKGSFAFCLLKFSWKSQIKLSEWQLSQRLATNHLDVKRSEEHTSELQSRFDLVCR